MSSPLDPPAEFAGSATAAPRTLCFHSGSCVDCVTNVRGAGPRVPLGRGVFTSSFPTRSNGPARAVRHGAAGCVPGAGMPGWRLLPGDPRGLRHHLSPSQRKITGNGGGKFRSAPRSCTFRHDFAGAACGSGRGAGRATCTLVTIPPQATSRSTYPMHPRGKQHKDRPEFRAPQFSLGGLGHDAGLERSNALLEAEQAFVTPARSPETPTSIVVRRRKSRLPGGTPENDPGQANETESRLEPAADSPLGVRPPRVFKVVRASGGPGDAISAEAVAGAGETGRDLDVVTLDVTAAPPAWAPTGSGVGAAAQAESATLASPVGEPAPVRPRRRKSIHRPERQAGPVVVLTPSAADQPLHEGAPVMPGGPSLAELEEALRKAVETLARLPGPAFELPIDLGFRARWDRVRNGLDAVSESVATLKAPIDL
jgi:hypothetical protein